jgi:hypothetical protein
VALDPQFATTPRAGAALLGGAETNLQVPTAASIVLTGVAAGTKIDEIVVETTNTTLVATTAAGLVYVFLYDGATYHLFDVVTVTVNIASATAAGFRDRRTYTNLVLPNNNWSLRASQSIAANANVLKVVALGADL